MRSTKTFLSTDQVRHVAHLAHLPVSEESIAKLQKELEATFEYINKIKSLNTKGVDETSQVTGLENVFREDIVDNKRTLPQKEVLSTAPSIYKGYFKVKAIFHEE